MKKPLIEVKQLTKSYKDGASIFSDLSFNIYEGETLGLVGDSGSGKSTLGKLILRLDNPCKGSVLYKGQDLFTLDRHALKKVRAEIQMVFQDPYNSLNPRFTVEQIVEEPLTIHKIGTKEERQKRVNSLLEMVGLSSAALKRTPHEFSGGQRQRIAIARALATSPRFLICDEPTSALDVSIQAQICNLLKDLQEELKLTCLLISHNLPLVHHLADRIALLEKGQIMWH